MSIISFVIGVFLPALIGWLLVDLLEGRTRVLFAAEKCTLALLLGLTLAMFCVFLAHVFVGIPLTLIGFLAIHGVLLLLLGIPWMTWKRERLSFLPVLPAETIRPAYRWILFAFCAWVGLRLLAFTGLLAFTPSFFDDTMDNWNLRGKIFFVDRALTLIFPWTTDATGVSSYPPTVPLAKTWLATLNGSWNEGLVNSIHIVWFAALLILTFWTLRRSLSVWWSLLGTTVLAGLPLVFIQGTGTYADIFLAAHLLAALSMIFHTWRAPQEAAPAYFRLAAFAIALVPFTKNEGFMLYFPVLALLFLVTVWMRRQGSSLKSIGWLALLSAAVCVPWIGFKVFHGLTFGNAKGIDWTLQWQPGVLQAILVNTFLEANWNLLMPLFFGMLVWQWRRALRMPMLLLTAFFAIPYFGQLFLYLFTGLSQEALFQTGYARGLIHVMPAVVILTTLLVHQTLNEREEPVKASSHSS